MKKLLMGALVALFLASCASTSGIKKYSETASSFNNPTALISNSFPMEDMYRIYKKGGSAFKAVEDLKTHLEKTIAEFAKKKGKSFVILGQQVVTGSFMRFPKIEIVFALTNKSQL